MAVDPDGLLYLDDLVIGQRFTSATEAIDADQIRDFASRFDPQVFHLDPDAAEATIFKGLAASGWHTAALTMRLMVKSAPPLAGGLVGAGAEIVWPMPTRPGDVLHVVGEITDVRASRSKPDRGIVSLRCETRNERGDVVQVLNSKLIVPRRPAATAGA